MAVLQPSFLSLAHEPASLQLSHSLGVLPAQSGSAMPHPQSQLPSSA
jgi:hypothetical protein